MDTVLEFDNDSRVRKVGVGGILNLMADKWAGLKVLKSEIDTEKGIDFID